MRVLEEIARALLMVVAVPLGMLALPFFILCVALEVDVSIKHNKDEEE